MFKESSNYQATTATLTPTRLLMGNPMQTNNWNFNQTSMSELNSYMNDISPFNQPTNMFNQKFDQPEFTLPPSPEDSSKQVVSPTQPATSSAQTPLTPPSPTKDTLPKKQRKKLLEKNREAAYRCRQKKKKWVNSLEERSQIAETRNRELQEQVSQLREESIYLRNLLLTHGNCECDVVQAYLRRTSEQLSNNIVAPPPSAGHLPALESASSVSGSESSIGSIPKKMQLMFDNNPSNSSGFMFG